MKGLVLLIGVIGALVSTSSAFGQSVGGFDFTPNAAADTATLVPGSQPSFYLCGATADDGAPTLPRLTPAQSAARVVTDGVADAELLGAAVVDVGFVDNVVVNGPGPDLVVFESGRPEAFALSVFDAITQSFSTPRTYLPASTGLAGGCGFQLNAATIDLADFGVLPDNARTLFRIDNLGAPGCCDGADLMDVLALSSGAPAPEPIIVPGVPFASNSGADAATVVSGSSPAFFQCGVTPELGAATLPGRSVDASATEVVSDGSADTQVFGKAVVDVEFRDNVVVNVGGPDLAVFESARPEGFTVAVFDPVTGAYSSPLHFDPVGIGFYDGCGYPVNAALIDLSAFGVPTLGTVSRVRIDNLGSPGSFDGADFSDVRAVHSAVLGSMEVKPGASTPASLNLKSQGVLPVALVSTPTFDALGVDPATVALGDPETGLSIAPFAWTTEDVNGDGLGNLLLRFRTSDLARSGAVTADTTRLVLTARTWTGESVIGTTGIRIFP